MRIIKLVQSLTELDCTLVGLLPDSDDPNLAYVLAHRDDDTYITWRIRTDFTTGLNHGHYDLTREVGLESLLDRAGWR